MTNPPVTVTSAEPARPGRRAQVKEAAAIMAVFALATLVVTWPVAEDPFRYIAGDPGDPILNAWVLAWNAEALRTLQNVWNAPIFFPYENTLAYSEHLIGVGWPLAPVMWLTQSPIFLYNVAFLLSFVLAGTGMYLLTRTLTGRRDAALVAGFAFAFCQYRWIQISHLQVLMWGWLPVSVWAVHEYFRTRSRAMLAVSVTAYALLGLSNAYFMFFGIFPVVIVGLYEWWKTRAPFGRVVLDSTLAAAVLASVFFPVARAYTAAGLTQSWAYAPGAVRDFGASFVSYVSAMPHIRFWSWLPQSPTGESALFPGLLIVVLSVLSFVRVGGRGARRVPPLVWLYAVIAVVGMVLTFGTRPDFWPRDSSFVWPYGWLVAVVPGFSAMRVPSRAAVIVFFALAVLSGFGTARVLASRWSRAVRWGAAAVLGVLIILDGYGGPMFVTRYGTRAPQVEGAAYAWISEGPPGAVMELPPQSELMRKGYSDLYYQFHTLVHGRPIVNGSSRFEPPLTTFLKSGASPLREATQLADIPGMLRAFGVRYVTVRSGAYASPDAAERTLRAFASSADIAEHRPFGSSSQRIDVFLLREPSPPVADVSKLSWRVVPRESFDADAFDHADRTGFALDGDPDTRWISGSRQEGDEWFDVILDGPRDVSRLRMLLAGSHGDYPRGLEITAYGSDDKTPQLLYRGSILPQLAVGILADPLRTPIDVDLPPNVTRRLRIRQTGNTRSFHWAIHEVGLWER